MTSKRDRELERRAVLKLQFEKESSEGLLELRRAGKRAQAVSDEILKERGVTIAPKAAAAKDA